MPDSNSIGVSAVSTQADAPRGADRRHAIARLLLAACYLAAGVLHLAAPRPFVAIVPASVPQPEMMVRVTGLCELAGALALLVPRTRRLAAVMLGLYAIGVYPANIQHAVIELSGAHSAMRWVYHAPRLFAQPFILWWTLYAGDIVGGLRLLPGRQTRVEY